MGHLPVVRSAPEVVGQVRWVILGDDAIDASPIRSTGTVTKVSDARVARAALLWAECLPAGRACPS
jgi:hypothetical protein